MAGIPDKDITKSVLDCLFFSTNFETEADAFSNEHKLLRYEFFEILVRIAHNKYVKTGILDENSNTRALHRLVNEHILNVVNSSKFPAW